MFSRTVLKNRAKEVLKTSYLQILAVVLINIFITQLISSSSVSIIALYTVSVSDTSSLMTTIITFAVSLVIGLFVSSPLTVGITKFILEVSRGMSPDYSLIGFAFKNGNYLNTVKAMSVRMLIGQLLSELMIIIMRFYLFVAKQQRLPEIPENIPDLYFYIGIASFFIFALYLIKLSFDYYLIEYIVADNPNIKCFEALKLSKQYMKGNRIATIVLGLSMIGWHLLGLMLCVFGSVFIIPYVHAVLAQLYFELSQKTINNYTHDNNINY